MLCDYHVHTIYSDDSVYEMEEVVKDGIKKEIKEFIDNIYFEKMTEYPLAREILQKAKNYAM